jgi:N-acetylglutamate synthase-like GNAT family acetyltransferase
MSRGNAIQTTHILDFEQGEYKSLLDTAEGKAICELMGIKDDVKFPTIKFMKFRVGTCEGLYRLTPESCEILAVENHQPNNGHFTDVLEWFEWSCKEMKIPLRIIAFTNDKFRQHLLNKRGFHEFGEDVEKCF